MITSKSSLAVALSKLKKFVYPSASNEQYATESEIAAEVLWFAYMSGDIEGKVVADLGCGTGILGIGCLLLGAKKVYFLDSDPDAIEVAKENYLPLGLKNASFILDDISQFDKKVDLVVQNPPFGVQTIHADRIFLDRAFDVSKVVYSFHKSETKVFIENYAKTNGFKPTHAFQFDFSLRATMNFHRKKVHHVMVGCWRLVRDSKIQP